MRRSIRMVTEDKRRAKGGRRDLLYGAERHRRVVSLEVGPAFGRHPVGPAVPGPELRVLVNHALDVRRTPLFHDGLIVTVVHGEVEGEAPGVCSGRADSALGPVLAVFLLEHSRRAIALACLADELVITLRLL